MDKIAYRIGNWREYNKALKERSNLAVWWNKEVQKNWYASSCKKSEERGRPHRYSNQCIEFALTIRSLFQLPLRSTQGFLEGFFKLLHLDFQVPHYSCLSRRASALKVQYNSKKARGSPIDLVIDSTGLKIYGEGEWKTRIHGKAKKRTWRKLHVAVDPNDFKTVSLALTEGTVHDSTIMPKLLKNKKHVGIVYADAAYISKKCFDAIAKIGATAKIALKAALNLVKKKISIGLQMRNDLIKEIFQSGGLVAWKKKSGYHKRSLVETHMYRFKAIFGPLLSSRSFLNQVAEVKIKTKILNKMTALGMPHSYKILS